MTEKVMNVYQRINLAGKILQQNPWIKDLTTSQYKSVDIDQIRKHVGAAEVEAGLVARYVEEVFEQTEINGKSMAKISATLVYINIDNPEDTAEFPRSAIAWDAGDKGFNKAESMFYKNLYKGLYHIGERSEDPDSFSVEEQDLLTHFKLCNEATKAQVLAIVQKNAKEMDKERKAENRRRKAAQAGDFFKISKDESGKDAGTIAKNHGASVDIDKAREALAKLRDADDPPSTVQAYIELFGPGVMFWSEKDVINCYLQLQNEGVL